MEIDKQTERKTAQPEAFPSQVKASTKREDETIGGMPKSKTVKQDPDELTSALNVIDLICY